MQCAYVGRDFVPDGVLAEPEWQQTQPVRLEYTLSDVRAMPRLSTSVKALWSDEYLYLAFEAPFKKLKMLENPGKIERLGLWDDDVVEAFIGPDPDQLNHYSEYEWAPNGETLDLQVALPDKDFEWRSRMDSVVRIDSVNHKWITEVRIPLASISPKKPLAGTRWRLNLYRHDCDQKVFLAWSPTLNNTAHTPSMFGWLEFQKPEN
jgi:hypothetical protein